MTLQLSAHARLGKDPRSIDTRTGTAMVVCAAAVNLPVSRSEDTTTLWLDLVAFGRTAEDLLRHQQGDLLNVMGHVQVRQWTDQQGQQRENWQLMVEALISARTTRPKGGGKRTTQQAGQHRWQGNGRQQAAFEFQSPGDQAADDEFGDSIPF